MRESLFIDPVLPWIHSPESSLHSCPSPTGWDFLSCFLSPAPVSFHQHPKEDSVGYRSPKVKLQFCRGDTGERSGNSLALSTAASGVSPTSKRQAFSGPYSSFMRVFDVIHGEKNLQEGKDLVPIFCLPQGPTHFYKDTLHQPPPMLPSPLLNSSYQCPVASHPCKFMLVPLLAYILALYPLHSHGSRTVVN